MGHPKKNRKKYSTPLHPWNALRIKDERQLINGYGLQNKKEIWKAESLLRKFKGQAKSLIARRDEQSKKEEKQLKEKLERLGLISKNAKLDDILSLNIKDILDRRLQTLLFKQKLARTAKQARQFILHGHVFVGEKKMNMPSYYVFADEENKISFSPRSSLFSVDHPERFVEKEIEEIKTQLKKIENAETREEKKAKKEEIGEKSNTEEKI